MMKTMWAVWVLLVFAWGPARADDFRVTVVAILASDRHSQIDPKLKVLAEEVRKREQNLTGWKIERQTVETMALHVKKTFPLVDGLAADVTVLSRDDKDKEKKIKMVVKAQHSPEITYQIVPDKYFPISTQYQMPTTKERLFFAVMVKPLPKADDKAKDKKPE